MILTVTTSSEEQTRRFGAFFAEILRGGDVVAINGVLAAGKTRFVQGVVAGLGGDPATVTSPTFTLLHEYETDPPVTHADAYRLADSDEFLALGISEHWDDGAIVLVEWASRVADALPRRTLTVTGTVNQDSGEHCFELRDARNDLIRPLAERLDGALAADIGRVEIGLDDDEQPSTPAD